MAHADESDPVEFFEKRVRPVLVARCFTCHSADTNSKGDLRVDDRNGLLNGGNGGPAVIPHDPDGSLLIQAVRRGEGAPAMPPKTPLPNEEVAALERWVREGAAWPSAAELVNPPDRAVDRYENLRKTHWAWQPIWAVKPPAVREPSWPIDELDRFVLAGLEEAGLRPVEEADRMTLIRRASFDLTGLPPSPEEVKAFAREDSPDAYERLVDRLIASAAFGERWARHWLDVARYGESTGSSRNLPLPHAWRYRDYVVDSFTRDKPYDQFLREQIAGDLLTTEDSALRDERKIATGFLAIGVKDVNQRFKVRYLMDNVDEQIDAVGRGLLATTISCARCHDHKFDPIPTRDYYALAGIFRSTDLLAGLRNKMGGGGLDYYDTGMLLILGDDPQSSAPSEDEIAARKKAVEEARAEFQKLRDSKEGGELDPNGRPKRFNARQRMQKLQAELNALTDPAANGAKIALGVRDSPQIADTEIRFRGEAEKLGPVVPRGFLSLVDVPGAPEINREQSGRRELAEWIASPSNPLTARVYVNRVWNHLFGQGIVRTVDNFGSTGDTPSHPQLLDHLASRFIEGGWSTKALVRSIVLSRSYRLSSASTEANLVADPSNRMIWRHSPRRLEAEEIRDAILAASGSLDLGRPEGSAAQSLPVIELPNNGPQARKLIEAAHSSRNRSLYLPLLRGIVPTSLEVFDFAEQGTVTGRRDATTVAPQGLFFLNDPFVRRESLRMAESILADAEAGVTSQIDRAYRLALGRAATASEINRAREFLEGFAADAGPYLLALAERQKSTPSGDVISPPATANANPDEVIQQDAPPLEEVFVPRDARTTAWAGLCQALLGSAEFRFVR
ncbi:MAG: PSD1 and planctomycete cytochrome C domain-containing protein [Isosphaeraceae bacterium]